MVELEEAVLGAILLDKDAFLEIGNILDASDFSKTEHVYIYKSIQELFSASKPIDTLTLTKELRNRKHLDLVGGAYYITTLTNRVASTANAQYHARLIKQASLLRTWHKVGHKVVEMAQNESDPFVINEWLEKQLQDINTGLSKGKSISNFQECLKEARIATEAAAKNMGVTGVPSGLQKLNSATGGYQPGDLVIEAGRPGMGKTSLAIQEAVSGAKMGIPEAIFSLEMTRLQLTQRIISTETEIDLERIRKGRLTGDEWLLFTQTEGELRKIPLYIDDTPSISISELRRKAIRLKNKHNIRKLTVDYLQLMRGEKSDNREQEISSISRGLKSLAKELDIPVIALAQLSRASEKRGTGALPILSDLRESGSIEQDADLVMFIHRPEYYGIESLEDGRSSAGIAYIRIAKHRNGSIETIELQFEGRLTRFK